MDWTSWSKQELIRDLKKTKNTEVETVKKKKHVRNEHEERKA